MDWPSRAETDRPRLTDGQPLRSSNSFSTSHIQIRPRQPVPCFVISALPASFNPKSERRRPVCRVQNIAAAGHPRGPKWAEVVAEVVAEVDGRGGRAEADSQINQFAFPNSFPTSHIQNTGLSTGSAMVCYQRLASLAHSPNSEHRRPVGCVRKIAAAWVGESP